MKIGNFRLPAIGSAVELLEGMSSVRPDTVNRKLEKRFKGPSAEYFFNFNYNELLPKKAAMRSLDLLTRDGQANDN